MTMFWTGFLVGMFVGGVFGGMTMCLMMIAKDSDLRMEQAYEADTEDSAVDDRTDSGHRSDPFARADRSRNGAERF
jgi:hypothetical protein